LTHAVNNAIKKINRSTALLKTIGQILIQFYVVI